MNKKKCLVEENKHFLWWKWKSRYYDHNWAYKPGDDVVLRKCLHCGRREIAWSRDEYGYIWKQAL